MDRADPADIHLHAFTLDEAAGAFGHQPTGGEIAHPDGNWRGAEIAFQALLKVSDGTWKK